MLSKKKKKIIPWIQDSIGLLLRGWLTFPSNTYFTLIFAGYVFLILSMCVFNSFYNINTIFTAVFHQNLNFKDFLYISLVASYSSTVSKPLGQATCIRLLYRLTRGQSWPFLYGQNTYEFYLEKFTLSRVSISGFLLKNKVAIVYFKSLL